MTVILDLCGGTGAWSKPYVDAGYEVKLLTLPEHDVRDYQHKSIWMEWNGPVHGILAAPPCTHFSFARQTAKTPRNFTEAMEVVTACLNIIWGCRADGHLQWWALENPVGYLRQFLGAPALTFKPCEFGDPWAKRTDLWGYFRPPKKLRKPVEVPKGHHRASAWHDLPANRQERRSITPAGFAQAFFKANP
jgi:hypothetical protein